LVFEADTISTSGSCGTGLKKWMPTRRAGSFSAVPMSGELEAGVFVARTASGFAMDSIFENRARFASRFSKIASMITSAWRAPSPENVRDQAIERVAHAALVAQPPLEELGGALHRRRDALGRRVLQRHRDAAHGADRGDVAPITPAPTTCTWRGLKSPLPRPLSRSAGRRSAPGWRASGARRAP